MLGKSSETPFGKRYFRYVRGLPAHPERAFGEETDQWKFKEGDEVFTATRRTRERVWQVIFELDDGDTFLKNGEENQGNLMCISPMDPRGSLMIRDGGVISIDGNNFLERKFLFYEPDGVLHNLSAEFQQMKKSRPGRIFGTVSYDLVDLVCRTADKEQTKSCRAVACNTAHMGSDKFQLNFGVVPKRNHADVRLERGIEGFVSHAVPLHLEHPKDAIDYLRQKINFAAEKVLM